MPLIDLGLGTQIDTPMISATPFLWSGYNIRVRAGKVETIGLFGPLKDVAGDQIVLPGNDVYRSLFTSPSVTTGQVIAGSVSALTLIEFDATSTPATGTRWATYDVTPAGLIPAFDEITDPSAARVEIPPVWWFDDQEDLVVGQRANVEEAPYFWDRNRVNTFQPIIPARHPSDPEWPTPPDVGPAPDPAPTPVPVGAVGGGIISRILVLLGASSFTDPDPLRYMTIRWSDRFNYGQWTPSDVTLSGETVLEGGSRIVGGGIVGFGVVAWTDKRMALLSETFDNNVFSRKYIDGGRGLLANQAWTEADGQVFWVDETRTLNVFDGGRPRQIINTNRYASIETLSDTQVARMTMEPNQEYGEIIIHYPAGESATEINAQLVYNYLHDKWYPWFLSRSAWSQRFGVIPNLAVDTDGSVWQHDLDVSLPPPWLPELPVQSKAIVDAADVEPFNFGFSTNMVTRDSPALTSWHAVKVTQDYLPSPADGAVDDFSITVLGYREANLKQEVYEMQETMMDGEVTQDFRVGGKAIRVKVEGEDIKTVYRFGLMDISGDEDGER